MKVLVLMCSHAGEVPAVPGAVTGRIADLCRTPDAIAGAVLAGKADRLVISRCPDTVLGDVHAQTLQAGLDPLGLQVQLVPAGDLARTGDMLQAAVARARAFTGSEPEHIKYRHGTLNRRALFRGAAREYEAAPAVNHADCAADSGCRACLDVCPHDAIRIEDGRIVHDTNVCEPCGRCVAACPTGATVNPAFTERMLEVHVRALVATAGQRPRGIAFHCSRGTAPAHAADWHEDWFPVPVPCVGMLPPTWLLAPLVLGAGRVTVLHCDGECRGGGVDDGAKAVAASRAVLRAASLPENLVADVDQLEQAPGAGLDKAVFVEAPFRHDGPARVFLALADAAGRDYQVSDPVLPTGLIANTAACTVCGACAAACPTHALGFSEKQVDGARLTFDASLCVACGQCVPGCPELAAGAIGLEHTVDVERLRHGRTSLRHSEPVPCRRCGKVVASQAMLSHILAALGSDPQAPPAWTQLCQGCRATSWG
jgi:ferredoxin